MPENDRLGLIFVDLASKKDDPNYEQVRGHVPKDLAMQFKLACTANRLDYSKGVEAALRLWLSHLEEDKQSQVSPPEEE